MAGFSMLSSIQNLTGRKSIRYTLLCIVIAGLAFIVLQIGSKYLLRQWLLENGADNVTIATMWLNPFSGKFSVNGVDIRRGDHVVYSNDIVHFNIGMFSLFEKDALIQQAILHDMMINIYRYESGVLNIVIGNGRYAAAGIPVAPQASLTDGKFDVVLYMGKSLQDQIFNSKLILQGEQESGDNILSLRAKKFAMKFSKPVNINYDGELYKREVDEISYAIHSRRLKVIVGKNFT